jgi:hypothetical protein
MSNITNPTNGTTCPSGYYLDDADSTNKKCVSNGYVINDDARTIAKKCHSSTHNIEKHTHINGTSKFFCMVKCDKGKKYVVGTSSGSCASDARCSSDLVYKFTVDDGLFNGSYAGQNKYKSGCMRGTDVDTGDDDTTYRASVYDWKNSGYTDTADHYAYCNHNKNLTSPTYGIAGQLDNPPGKEDFKSYANRRLDVSSMECQTKITDQQGYWDFYRSNFTLFKKPFQAKQGYIPK